jgi:hypothetical protein
LKRTNPNAIMKWFARGKLWDTPEQAHWAAKNLPREKRGRDWRPGGQHQDPRARFDKPKDKDRRDRVRAGGPSRGGPPRGSERSFKGGKPAARPRQPWSQPPRKTAKPEWRRREEAPRRREESPEKPPAPEQIVIKPKPPERG